MDNPFESISAKLDLIAKQVENLESKLIASDNTSSNQQMEMGGVELAIKLTGLSKSAIYGHTSKGSIPVHKPPGTKSLIFYRNELEAWIKNINQTK